MVSYTSNIHATNLIINIRPKYFWNKVKANHLNALQPDASSKCPGPSNKTHKEPISLKLQDFSWTGRGILHHLCYSLGHLIPLQHVRC